MDEPKTEPSGLQKFLEDALASGRKKIRGQRRGPIMPGPRRLAVCDPCTSAARKRDPEANAQGVALRDLARHLAGFHGFTEKAVEAALKGLR